jgi:transposase InsO family protein
MSVRRLIVESDATSLNVTEFCAQHRISTWFFYDLRRRYAAEGAAALELRSRAPHRVANRTPVAVEDVIVALRKELTDAGLDAGPATIAYHLDRDGVPVPSEATIWRILHRRGFMTPDPSKAPKHTGRRFAAERANECWQYDDTHWCLADGTEVKIFNALDDCSRLALACQAVPTVTMAAIFEALAAAASEWGWPERTLSDNAKAHVALDETFAALGIATIHSRPYHPQTCGKVERFHQTQQRWLTAQPTAETLDELQDQLDRFRTIYNHHRPHRSVGRHTPAEAWTAAPKSGPTNRPLNTPTRIHHVVVSYNGVVYVGRYAITIGRAHAHADTTVIITGLACHLFIAGRLMRSLTLDPTRRTQPLGLPSPQAMPRDTREA